jgi:hypothetical protein
MTGQTVLGSAGETNLWMQRRRAMQLPSVEPALLSSPISPAESCGGLISALSTEFGVVQEVYHAKTGDRDPVVLLQDVHLNVEAQTNIAALLQKLIDRDRVDIVGVEGEFGDFDFGPYRNFPDKKIARDVSRAFLNARLLGAASYVGITSQRPPPLFIGVDDRAHYDANVQAYLNSRRSKEAAVTELRARAIRLNIAKRILPKTLRELEADRADYATGRLALGAYLKKLANRIPINEQPAIVRQFLAAHHLETQVDFQRVTAERKAVLDRLVATLAAPEMAELTAQSSHYRMGQIGFGAYYRYLKSLCASKHISLHRTPAFDAYVRYVLASDDIKAGPLLKSVGELEQQAIKVLAVTAEQRAVMAESEQLLLAQKLTDFALTPGEWARYRSGRIPGLDDFEHFYEQADARSEAMVANLLSHRGAAGSAVLIAGGFHTPEIAHILRKKQISYVVVSPKITKVDTANGSSYLSVFAREKTPLDRLFQGERLFLCPPDLQITTPRGGIPLLAAFISASKRLRTVLLSWNKTRFQVIVPADMLARDRYEIISLNRAWTSLPEERRHRIAAGIAWLEKAIFNGDLSPKEMAAYLNRTIGHGLLHQDILVSVNGAGYVCGFITELYSNGLWLAQLGVEKRKERRGHGTKLMDVFFANARARRWPTVRWQATYESVSFYDRYLSEHHIPYTMTPSLFFEADASVHHHGDDDDFEQTNLNQRTHAIASRRNAVSIALDGLKGQFILKSTYFSVAVSINRGVMTPAGDRAYSSAELLNMLIYDPGARLTKNDAIIVAPSGLHELFASRTARSRTAVMAVDPAQKQGQATPQRLTPGITAPRRNSHIDEFISDQLTTMKNKGPAVVVDVGVGVWPVTTQELADILGYRAHVIGVDTMVPRSVVKFKWHGRTYRAFFDDAGNVLYFLEGNQNPSVTVKNIPMSDLLRTEARRRWQKLIEQGHGQDLIEPTASIEFDPMQRFLAGHAELRVGNIFSSGFLGTTAEQSVDVIRAANLFMHFTPDQTKKALQNMAPYLKPGGLVVIGKDRSLVVFKKTPAGLNAAYVMAFPNPQSVAQQQQFGIKKMFFSGVHQQPFSGIKQWRSIHDGFESMDEALVQALAANALSLENASTLNPEQTRSVENKMREEMVAALRQQGKTAVDVTDGYVRLHLDGTDPTVPAVKVSAEIVTAIADRLHIMTERERLWLLLNETGIKPDVRTHDYVGYALLESVNNALDAAVDNENISRQTAAELISVTAEGDERRGITIQIINPHVIERHIVSPATLQAHADLLDALLYFVRKPATKDRPGAPHPGMDTPEYERAKTTILSQAGLDIDARKIFEQFRIDLNPEHAAYLYEHRDDIRKTRDELRATAPQTDPDEIDFVPRLLFSGKRKNFINTYFRAARVVRDSRRIIGYGLADHAIALEQRHVEGFNRGIGTAIAFAYAKQHGFHIDTKSGRGRTVTTIRISPDQLEPARSPERAKFNLAFVREQQRIVSNWRRFCREATGLAAAAELRDAILTQVRDANTRRHLEESEAANILERMQLQEVARQAHPENGFFKKFLVNDLGFSPERIESKNPFLPLLFIPFGKHNFFELHLTQLLLIVVVVGAVLTARRRHALRKDSNAIAALLEHTAISVSDIDGKNATVFEKGRPVTNGYAQNDRGRRTRSLPQWRSIFAAA